MRVSSAPLRLGMSFTIVVTSHVNSGLEDEPARWRSSFGSMAMSYIVPMSMMSTLQTARLILRPYQESDREAFVLLNCDADVRQRMDGPLSLDSADSLFSKILAAERTRWSFSWAIVSKAGQEYIGHAFIVGGEAEDYELGYLFVSKVWGQGYGTEAVTRIVQHGFDSLGLDRLVATVDVGHTRSIRILEKTGFELEETKEEEGCPYHLYVAIRPAPL